MIFSLNHASALTNKNKVILGIGASSALLFSLAYIYTTSNKEKNEKNLNRYSKIKNNNKIENSPAEESLTDHLEKTRGPEENIEKQSLETLRIDCKFCDIVNHDPDQQVIYKNNYVTIFEDTTPGGKVHLQTVSRRHIDDISHLTKDDAPLIKHMSKIGLDYAKSIARKKNIPFDEVVQGFHHPENITQSHLHLHTVVSPIKSTWRAVKYRPYSKDNEYGLISVDEVIKEIETE